MELAEVESIYITNCAEEASSYPREIFLTPANIMRSLTLHALRRPGDSPVWDHTTTGSRKIYSKEKSFLGV